MNPYTGKTLLGYFGLLFSRLGMLLEGKLALSDLATDEVQILVLIGLAIASSCIGVFLVLKKMTMLANSLSHTILFGIVLAYLFIAPFSSHSEGDSYQLNFEVLFIGALLTGLITAVCTQLLTHFIKLQEDASIGLVFTTFFALGIVLVTLFTRNAHIGTEVVLGNIDALHFDDLKIMVGITVLNVCVIGLFFKEFQITAFDPLMAASVGVFPSLFNYLLIVLTAGTAIASFRAVGVLLFLAFLVGPVLTARLFTDRLKPLIFLSIAIGVLSSVLGAGLARHFLTVYHMPLSTAGLVVCTMATFYLLSLLFSIRYKRCQTL
jgi:manganese/zinc/iron transport system permease protein